LGAVNSVSSTEQESTCAGQRDLNGPVAQSGRTNYDWQSQGRESEEVLDQTNEIFRVRHGHTTQHLTYGYLQNSDQVFRNFVQ
jgi:hypothetical protein